MTSEPQRDEFGRFLPKAESQAPDFIEIGADSGTAKLTIEDEDVLLTDDNVLGLMGLDARVWEVKSLSRRKTMLATGGVTRSINVRVARKAIPEAAQLVDIDELMSIVDGWEFTAPDRSRFGHRQQNHTYVLALADWQIGGGVKGTPDKPGRGTADTVRRVLAAVESAKQHIAYLQEHHRVEELALPGLGDLVESCIGFYASQLYNVDLNERDQIKTAYGLIMHVLRELAPMFQRVRVLPVGGNHGENTRARGRQQTDTADNRDLLVFDVAKAISAEIPELSHVTFEMPDNPLYAVHELSGVRVGITHGHLFNGGANAAAKAERWWKGQAFGRTDLAEADILLSGHFHSFACAEFAKDGRTWLQVPAMDAGSEWFLDATGISSPPGMLSFTVSAAHGPRGYSNLMIH